MSSQSAAVLRFVKLTDKALTLPNGSTKAAGFDTKRTYDATVYTRGKE